jgi:hypothetical protein
MSFRESFSAAKECHYAGTCHAERSEASRSLNVRVLIKMNEILRLRCTSAQNDIGQETVISSEARNPWDAARGDTCGEEQPKRSIREEFIRPRLL